MKHTKITKPNTSFLKNIQLNINLPSDFRKISQIEIKFTQNVIAGPKSTDEIYELLKKIINLENLKINLRKNNIGSQGLQQIGKALKGLPQLKSFFLKVGSMNNIGSAGFSSLSQSICLCPQLTSLDLYIDSTNYLKSDGIIALAKTITSLQLLQNFLLKIDDNRTYLTDGFLQLLINLSKCKQLQNLTLISLINESKLKLNDSEHILRYQCLKEMYKFTTLITKGILQIESSYMMFDKTNQIRVTIEHFLNSPEQQSKNEFEDFKDIEELKYYDIENLELIKSLINNTKSLKFLYLDYKPTLYQIIQFLPQQTNLTQLNLEFDLFKDEDAQMFLTQVMLCKNLEFLSLTGHMRLNEKIIKNELVYSFKNIIYLNIMLFDNSVRYYCRQFRIKIQKKFLKQKRLVKYQAITHTYPYQ